MSATTMTYGAYSFSPVPMLTLSEPFDKRGDDTMLGTTVSATLTGTLTPLPANDSGLDQIITLQDELRAAMDDDGQHFVVKCGSDTLIDKYPRVVNISFAPTSNNWTLTSTFTISLEWDETQLSDSDGDSIAPYVKNVDDSWTVEFQDNVSKFSWSANGTTDANSILMRVSRNISATGKHVFQSGGIIKEAWEQAEEWVTGRLGWYGGVGGDAMMASHGVLNMTTGGFSRFNHMRSKIVDETAGNFQVTENWLILDTTVTGQPGNVTEDFNVSVRKSNIDSDLTSVSVDGSIQGLETRSYGDDPGEFTISTTKYEEAVSAWPTISGRLYNRAVQASNGIAIRSLHITPLLQSLAHTLAQGSLKYTWEFDDRPCNYISGALSELIQINETHPTDIFASLAVLGRAKGPVLQSIDTVTSPTKDVSIEAVMPPMTGCSDFAAAIAGAPTSTVECLLKTVEDSLTAAYDQVFKTSDGESWSPKTGRYSRNVSWTMGICTGDAIGTSMSCT